VIAADTSTWVAFFAGEQGPDTRLLERALADKSLAMIPAVLTELLSDPQLPSSLASSLVDIPLLEPAPGYWHRAGATRAKVLAKGRKARLGDALIAQSCVDSGVYLITRDKDFRAFAEAAALHLFAGSP